MLISRCIPNSSRRSCLQLETIVNNFGLTPSQKPLAAVLGVFFKDVPFTVFILLALNKLEKSITCY